MGTLKQVSDGRYPDAGPTRPRGQGPPTGEEIAQQTAARDEGQGPRQRRGQGAIYVYSDLVCGDKLGMPSTVVVESS